MDKRYQVFLSSTYTDLKDERQKVIQTLMEMDCIPAGMELFPAMDEEQFKFIKKIIDDCDYYLLIIGGRYGSTTPEEGISYTEKEYDYALEKNLKVIALLHSEPDSIPVKNTDSNPHLREKLAQFRKKAETGRLVKYWKEANELPGLVSVSLHKTIKDYPAVGWVRADSIGSKLSEEIIATSSSKIQLSNAASVLLKEASVNPDGTVLYGKFPNFTSLQVNGKNLIPSDERRIVAEWESAFEELVKKELLKVRTAGGAVYEITSLGYEIADKLKIIENQKEVSI